MKNKFSIQRGSFTRTIKLFCLTFIAMFALSSEMEATHFRYNSMSWSKGTNDTVIFKIRQAWRATFFGGVALGNQVGVGTFDFGDGNAISLNLTVQIINTTDDWFEGDTTIKYKYATAGTYITQFASCCRLSNLLGGNADANYDIRSRVTVGGVVNNSPVSSVQPIVSFQLNSANTFLIPGFDPDGDAITFSVTPAGQSGLSQIQPVGLTLSPTGLINWTPTVPGLYALSVRVTDSKGDYVTIDFLLKVSATTSNPPVYNYAVTPANNFVYSVLPGTPINFNVEANDIDAGSQVTLIATGTPSGATYTPSLPTTSNPVSTSFSWTPTFANLGSYIISFTATDNNGQQATTNVIINVNTNPVFDVPPTPPLGFNYCLMTGTAYSYSIQAQNTLSAVNTSIVSMSGLPASATTSPALPTAPAAIAMTTLNWTPAVSDWGPHTVTFTATDVNSLSTTHSFNLLVNTSPYFTSAMPSSAATVGILYTHALSGADLNIPYGDDLEFHGVSLPSFLTLVDNGNGTASLSGTPALADIGTYTFKILLEDTYHHCGPEIAQTITLTVSGGCNLVVTAPSVARCISGAPITLLGTPAGGTWNLPNPYTGTATSYTYTYTDGNGCTGTATGSIVPASVTPAVIQTPIVANTTTATITWAPVPGTTKYYLWYKPVSAPNSGWLTPTFITGNTFTLSNLIPGTLYEVKIRNNNETCNLYGSFSQPVQFTTGTEPCGIATTVTATEVPVKKLSFTWAAVSGVAQYNLWYRKLPSGSWVTTTFGTGFTNFTTPLSLTDGTYEYKIRNRCATAITYTAFSASQTISIGTPIKPTLENAIANNVNMFPNPTNDLVNVEIMSNEAGSTSIKVFDVTGRLMKEVKANTELGMNSLAVSLKEFTSGIYIVQVSENGKLTFVNRIRKQE